MDPQAWFVVAVVAAMAVVLIKDWAPADVIFVGAAALFALFGIIEPAEAFAGFSNAGLLTVATLFVVAAGMRETGVLEYLGQYMLGAAHSEKSVLGRLSVLVVPMSALLNNTPIVAMFLPVVVDWCRRHDLAPSRLLIPLSYLAILGGTCTLIGTSTNLVVHGLMIEHGMRGIGLFEIGLVGVPYAIIGVTYLFLFGGRLLPDRKELLEQLGESRREYLVEMLATPSCRLIGKSVESGGLRQLPGLFLAEIERRGRTVSPVGPEEIIEADDRLIFTGIVGSIIDLEKIPGLQPITEHDLDEPAVTTHDSRMCEAVISESSPLVGKTVRDAEFRAAYNAVVVAVHRAGERMERKIGDIRLRPGDTLLLQTTPHFTRAHRNDPAFYLVSDVEEYRPLRRERAGIALAIFAGLLILMTTEMVPIVVATALAAVLMIAFGCISAGEARRSIELQVLITIAGAFAVGLALEKSGAAVAIVDTLLGNSIVHPLLILAIIYLVAATATELVTNNAAAVLMFPFCLEAARITEADPRPFLMALVLAASASFVTPIGYQTNMMVYGPGGYRFTDYVRIGLPLNLILFVIAVILIPIVWPFVPR